MALDLPYLRPVALVLVEVATTILAVGFTLPSSKYIRMHGMILVAACTYFTVQTTRGHVSNVMVANVLAGNAMTYLLRYLELALLEKWSFDDRGPTRMKSLEKEQNNAIKLKKETLAYPRQATAWQRLKFGASVTLNPRQLNTPHQIRNVPTWSKKDPQYVPSRGEFLRRTAVKVLLSYLIVDICTLGAQPERNDVLFSDEKVRFFARLDSVSLQELLIRVSASLILWLNIWCIFNILHGSLMVFAVGSGFTSVKDWRPPFGSLSEAYSVRRFWGYVAPFGLYNSLRQADGVNRQARLTDYLRIFWHQMFRQTFGGPARFLVHDVLQIPQNTLWARYAKIFATFFISGLLHLPADMVVGMAVAESGAVQFFCIQAFGMLFEDCVQELYHRIRPREQRSSRERTLARIIGYAWLCIFLSWSTPVWTYPAIRRNRGDTKDVILPYSIMKPLIDLGQGVKKQ